MRIAVVTISLLLANAAAYGQVATPGVERVETQALAGWQSSMSPQYYMVIPPNPSRPQIGTGLGSQLSSRCRRAGRDYWWDTVSGRIG